MVRLFGGDHDPLVVPVHVVGVVELEGTSVGEHDRGPERFATLDAPDVAELDRERDVGGASVEKLPGCRFVGVPPDEALELFAGPRRERATKRTSPVERVVAHRDLGLVEARESEDLPVDVDQAEPRIGDLDSAVAIVHVIEQLGREVTRERFLEAFENLKGFDTGILAGTMSFSPENHQGAEDVYVVGYNDKGQITIYESWDKVAQ